MAGSYIECAVNIAGNLENFNNEIVFLCFQVSLSLNFCKFGLSTELIM